MKETSIFAMQQTAGLKHVCN